MEIWVSHSKPRQQTALAIGCTLVGALIVYGARGFQTLNSNAGAGFLLGFLLLFSWMGLTGVVRAEFLRGRNFDYVRAAMALGVSDSRIMMRHILPNAMVATLTFLPFIPATEIGTVQQLIYGAAMTLLMIFRPGGIAGQAVGHR